MPAAGQPLIDPYRLIVESVRDYAMILLDAEGRVTSWNPGAEAIKGYTAGEIVGQHFSRFYTEEERATKPQKELEIAAAVGRFEEEGWRVRKNGSRFWASVVITAVNDETGAVIGFAKISRDLSERRAAQEERERHRQAERALSTPVIRLSPGILLLPLVGEVDGQRTTQIMEVVLSSIVKHQARVVIIDVAGVPTMDTFLANALLQTTSAVHLLGAQTVLTGISPLAATTMVRLGVDLSKMITQNQLSDGLEIALRLVRKT